jgi:hypothetical protein
MRAVLGTEQRPQWNGVEPALRANQVLVGALLAGLLSFTGVVLALQTSGSVTTPPGASPDNVLLIVMGVLTIATFAGSLVMRRLHIGQLRRMAEQGVEMSDRLLMGRYAIVLILRAALAEGPALFGAVIVLISGNMLGFLGTAFGAIVLLAIFPTRGKFDGFVRDATGRAPGM